MALASCSTTGKSPQKHPFVSISAVGDLMFDRGVGEAVWKNGSHWAMEKVRDDIASADIAFANLESPISKKSAMLEKPIGFRSPPGTAGLLADAGFDVVSLANNHSVDCGRDGLLETMAFLGKSGLHWCGAGKDRREAEKACIIKVNGLRVAFVAFSQFPEGSRKMDKVPTIALAEPGTVSRVIAGAAKKADIVVASFHWGEEYAPIPTGESRTLAREAADAGAALILGHHPHVVQGLETIPRRHGRPALVAWSLGNFIFDQKETRTREGLVLHCRMDRGGVESARLAPVRIDGLRPRPADPAETKATISTVATLSPAGLINPDGSLNLP